MNKIIDANRVMFKVMNDRGIDLIVHYLSEGCSPEEVSKLVKWPLNDVMCIVFNLKSAYQWASIYQHKIIKPIDKQIEDETIKLFNSCGPNFNYLNKISKSLR